MWKNNNPVISYLSIALGNINYLKRADSLRPWSHQSQDMAMTKKLCFTGPSYLPTEQFYQPGECEEAGWPGVTHIVASAFEGASSPLGPGMGWLNRFSVFTAGLPPSAHFNLSNNKRCTEELEFFNLFRCLFRDIPLQTEQNSNCRGVNTFDLFLLAKAKQDE